MMSECDEQDLVERMQNLDTQLYLAEDILTKVDRASMAVSLEVRAPFLDHRVAEFAASLPGSYKLRRHKTKYILKKAVDELLPRFVTRRGKKGFGVPVAEWLKDKLRPMARDFCRPSVCVELGFSILIMLRDYRMSMSEASRIIASCSGPC